MRINTNYAANVGTKNVNFGINTGKLLKAVEFNGFNFSTVGLGIVTYGAVLAPRYFKARDPYERREILFRDFSTITTILFARRAIQNVVARACAKKTGLALSLKPANHQGFFKKVFNYLRPDKGVHILSSPELSEKYTNVHEYKNGLLDFAKFLEGEGGDIKKVLTSDKSLKESLKKTYEKWENAVEKTGNFESASTAEITKMLKETAGKKQQYEGIKEIEEFFKKPDNSVAKRAKTINANFDFLTMLIVIPSVLGVLLPCINERVTKKALGGAPKKD